MAGPEQVAELYLSLDVRAKQLEAETARAERSLQRVQRAAKDTSEELEQVSEGADDSAKSVGGLEGSLTRLTPRLTAARVAGGALAAALTLAVAEAIKLEAAIDGTAKSLEKLSPLLARDGTALRERLLDVVQETGRSFDELEKAGRRLGAQGVQGVEDFASKLRAASALADATGGDFDRAAEGLQRVVGLFGESAVSADEVAQQLARSASIGVSLDSLLDAFDSAGPILRESGLAFDVASDALATLISEGLSGSQAAEELKRLAKGGEEGAAELQSLASRTREVTKDLDAMAAVEGRVNERARESARLSAIRAKNLEGLRSIVRAVKETWAELRLEGERLLTVASQLLRFIPGFGADARPTAAAPRPLPRPTPPPSSTGGGAGGSSATTAAAARDAARALAELQKLAGELQRELLPQLEDRFADLREELERLANASGPAGEKLAAAARQTLSILEAIETTPTVTGGAPAGTILGIRPTDLEGLATSLGVATDELEAFFREAEDAQEARELFALLQEIAAMKDFASGIAAVAEAMATLGSATGLVGEEAGKVLSQFGGLVDAAGNLGGAVQALQAGTGSAGDVIQQAANLAIQLGPVIAEAFGESPAVREATEALKRNAEQLRENTAALIDVSITGNERSDFDKALEKFFGTTLPDLRGRPRVSTGAVEGALEEFGISLQDLERWAKEADLEFVPLTRETLPQFLQFLTDLGERLERASVFGEGFAGELNKLTTGFKFSGTDAAGQFAAIVNLLTDPKEGAPAIFEALKGIDISTAEGASRARDILEELFQGLEEADTGQLTTREVLDALLQLLGILPPLAEELEDVVTPAERFADAMAAIGRAARVFDLSTIEQVERFFDTVAEFAPAIGNQLGSFDLSTAEGLNEAIAYLQDLFLRVEDGSISLEGLGFSLDDIVQAIDMLQGAAADAADEVERLAREEERRAEQAARDAERSAEEVRRAQERAAEEARRAVEQAERDRVATGDRALFLGAAQAGLFDITGTDLLRFRAAIFNRGSGGLLDQITGGADLAARGGQQVALDALRQFFLANPGGVSAGTFGSDAVQRQILDLAELLKEQLAIDVTGGGRVESFGFNRNITEASADVISGQLGTANILAEEQLLELQAIRSLLTPLNPVTISPPALPTGSPAAAATSVGSIAIYLPSGEGLDASSLSAGLQLDIRRIAAELVRELGIQAAGGS